MADKVSRSGEEEENGKSSSISVSGMQFGYDGQPPLFVEFNLNIFPGSRCLLVGANGSGKTTLLRILAGKHMVGGRDVVRVLNHSAFHDTQLVCGGDLAYLGGSWSKTIGSAWRMHKVSDGQRRRVQICMGLLYPFQVLLLDEVTVDLDVVARMDLLDFFREECEQRGATIVYATHIFDGLETWATHLAYIQDGELRRSEKLSEVDELKSSTNLLSVVESWLRSETKQEKKKPITASSLNQKTSPFGSSPFTSSRHMAYYR
ncbi:ABC transporter I family member 19-like isoform X2 [Tripterygium wilfordii]|uniref:ABC transporter I family member 19-like isoform X2 n=1 Tax=Tripterygium wilfordii TaxID=458696 RepID=UPI0018F8538A|nr:ABC transporter I family member 19-like isoform X2 [Tripterygium wilfordii]